MELKDAKSFRVSAQKARAKEMPKIPKDHDEMDPEKVKVFCDQGQGSQKVVMSHSQMLGKFEYTLPAKF